MRNKLTLLMAALVCCLGSMRATDNATVNITPRPAEMTVGTGTLLLPRGLKVGYAATLPAEMKAETAKFTRALNQATGLDAEAAEGRGLIAIALDSSLPAEGYGIEVTPEEAIVTASTPAGLYYGFQTLKKMLPANVMAGVAGGNETVYALPVVSVKDEPRFPYRGFMLDVSRHFFDVNEVKKMIDLMATYKMNRFHFHLTDDQGWRLPMEKYPKLTREGATNRNILRTDFDAQRQWREGLDTPYGPYAYTKEELKDIVAYAKERHIEVIPEIDMPGHMVAAIHAYPEFSTDPDRAIAREAGIDMDSEPVPGNVESHFTHNLWNTGGVSRDVLDISNPKVMEFVTDVVDELADIFPYEYIHIGGDECPTWAWERSDGCKALKAKVAAEAGVADDDFSFRALQSWFTGQVGNYAAEKHGKKLMGWNELVTASGAYMPMLAPLNPVIYCWVGAEQAARKSEELGMEHIYTPHDGGYYINRCYRGFDKVGAVGDGALSLSYNNLPPETDKLIGVQATVWTEQIDRDSDLEYQILPRLLAIAEHGWTPSSLIDYDNFMGRAIADSAYFNLAGLNYARHQLVMPKAVAMPDPDKWYRLKSTAGAERDGLVMEVLPVGSPIIVSQADKGAREGRLWGVAEEEGNDSQLFRFVPDPEHAGRYAIVCKAMPEGSLSPVATDGRWDYRPNELTYGFTFDRAFSSDADGTLRHAIRSSAKPGSYLNFSRSGQGLAINVYHSPADGSGGIIAFVPAE
ncbi:MAG: beta-N-acetylhexosaminidase [Pseudoflavonifractor sp.]|nr:beta-N-acetylhexosaminidase [Alloprevotella sp.]MCM1116036.1 beta-N-acetylhexosaminidase [Pseudoflavonifractor sp.]